MHRRDGPLLTLPSTALPRFITSGAGRPAAQAARPPGQDGTGRDALRRVRPSVYICVILRIRNQARSVVGLAPPLEANSVTRAANPALPHQSPLNFILSVAKVVILSEAEGPLHPETSILHPSAGFT